MKDADVLNGIMGDHKQRAHFEKQLYLQCEYFIKDGCRKFGLTYDDSFSAYTDALLSVIQNIINNKFNSKCSIKTYLFKVFSNKCIDTLRRRNTCREKMYHSAAKPELLDYLPDTARDVVEQMTNKQMIGQIKHHLDTIGERNKELLLLYEDGYTDEQIAKRLRYKSWAVVKTTRLRCLKKIVECVRPSLAIANA